MKIRNVIFDLDGTLLDTSEGILESVEYAIKEMGYAPLPDEKMRTFVGPPMQMSFINHYGCSQAEAKKAAAIFRENYMEHTLFKAFPYEGIYDLCDELETQEIHMAVATYKREDLAIRILRHFGFDRYCVSMHGADDAGQLKKEEIIRMCMDEMGGTRVDTLFVGDTTHDAVGAEKAGVPFVAVTYGFGFQSKKDKEAYDCVGVVSEPFEIIGILSERWG